MEYILQINLADKTKGEVKATGKFFRDITNVFKVQPPKQRTGTGTATDVCQTLTIDELYYVNVIRNHVHAPRGTLGVPNVTTPSWTREVTQIQNCVHRMQVDAIKAATKDIGISFSGHLATDHFKAALDELRGFTMDDEATESDSEGTNLSQPSVLPEMQDSGMESESKMQGETTGKKRKFAEETADQFARGKEELDL